MHCSIAVSLFVGLLAVCLRGAVASGPAVKNFENVFSPHIIGGEQVHFTERPYTVKLTLTQNGEYVRTCGGARLNRQWFVTGAECLDTQKYNEIELVYPANHPPNYWVRTKFTLGNLKLSIHPEYNNVTKVNNIGLLKCVFCISGEELKLPKKSEKDETFSALTAIVAAWTIPDETVSPDESKITSYDTKTMSLFLCRAAYFFISVNGGHICASTAGGKRLTENDVGVPLVVRDGEENSKVLKLIGIGSSIKQWSTITSVPSVFTRVAPYVEWISQETGIKVLD